MAKTLLNIKTDREVKDRAKRLAEELGVPLSTVVNAYLKEFIRTREVRLTVEPQIRPEIGKLLKKASADHRAGKNITAPFKSAKEAAAYLNRR